MAEKKRVGIVFGGRSAEHEISIQSAKSIITAIDKDRFDLVLIGIDRKGRWFLNDESRFLLESENGNLFQITAAEDEIAVVPRGSTAELIDLNGNRDMGSLDVVFPILHGPYGEDGSVQGLFKLADLPFVGAGILGSAVGMDKDVMKRLLRDAGVPIAAFRVVRAGEQTSLRAEEAVKELGLPLYVKPANLGSSVGITKVREIDDLPEAVDLAFQYDRKIIIEEEIKGREIECSVLGNDDPIASLPGEIVSSDGFYSYKAKYIDENGAELIIPADLPANIRENVQAIAVRAFQVLCCEGLARVDIFLREDGRVFVNEINTLPGFTKISMYPKLWEASGISYKELISRIIDLAIERHGREKSLKIDV